MERMTNTAANCSVNGRPVDSCGLKRHYLAHDNESFLHAGDKKGGDFKGVTSKLGPRQRETKLLAL